MVGYLIGRIIGLVIVFVIVSILAFRADALGAGRPVRRRQSPLPPAGKANILRKYGLDQPLYEQYLRYMGSALHGDFGISFQSPTETVTAADRPHLADQHAAGRAGDPAGVQQSA